MRIALINPKYPNRFNDARIEKIIFDFLKEYPKFTPNLTILTLAEIFSDFVDVDIIDENYQGIDYSIDYDLVGITSMTYQAYRAYEISDKFRKKGVPVILGGVHPTLMPKEASEHADSIFIGESEDILQTVADDLKKNQLKPAYHGVANELIKPLFPKYQVFRKLMEETQKLANSQMVIPIQVTRGCPYNCSFCTANKLCGSKIRKKGIKNVLLEIERIGETFDFDDIVIGFTDENIFVDRRYISDLLSELKRYKLSFACAADISLGEDHQLLEKLSAAGCRTLSFGLETVNNLSIKEVGKHKSRYHHRYKELLKNVKENKIPMCAYFIFGWDNDTIDTFSETIDFVFDNDIDSPKFLVCTPLPKTMLEGKLIAEGRILEKDYWDKCNLLNVLYKPKQMTKEELEDNLYQTYSDVYKWKLPLDQINNY